MNIINLTPHTLNIQREDGTMLEIPASGQIARLAESREALPSIAGLAVSRPQYGKITGLPEAEEGKIFVVSAMVLAQVKNRPDVFAPGEAIRNDAKQIIGCIGLSAASKAESETPQIDIETLLSVEDSATNSYGYGGWLSGGILRMFRGEDVHESSAERIAIIRAAYEYLQATTPAELVLDLPENVTIEQERSIFSQTLSVIVKIERGGDYRQHGYKVRDGQQEAMEAHIRADIKAALEYVG